MIELDRVRLRQGERILFDSDHLRIADGWHLGITGANGCGKSSLFRLLLGQTETDAGKLFISKDQRLACMSQEVSALEISAMDYVLDGDERLKQANLQRQQAEQSGDGHAIANAHALLDTLDAWTAPTRAASLMAGLGFSEAQQQQMVADFSGGWRMRLNLARTLMANADVLLLDEPTNHLDLDAIMWLGDKLAAYPGTLLLVSHDRHFLDTCVGHIVHIEQQKLHYYNGNYSSFERQRAEQLSQQQKSFDQQQKQRAHLQSFIDRFQAKATKARQAQSRIKALERLQLTAPAHADSGFSFTIPTPERLPNPLLSLNAASCGYHQPLLTDVNLTITSQTRIGLLGANGAGKSTLIKTLAGILPLCGGERIEANQLAIGYFHQQQVDQLDMNASPFELLSRQHDNLSELDIRKALGQFGFQGDRVFEKVGDFSGGEKTRLALALLTRQQPWLLLLDEPSNHLDIAMRDALAMALQDYGGAMILISHDRTLLDTCVDEFLLVQDGGIRSFDGDLEAYAKLLREQTQASNSKSKPANSASPSLDARARRQQSAQRRKQLKPLNQSIKKLEAELEHCSEQQHQIETALADESLYQDQYRDQLQQRLAKQAQLTKQKDELEEALLLTMEELEQLSLTL